ncbi:MAG: sigma-70 family RNA polymerase sigma factor [Tepidisphaeraceae bacterium]
MGGFVQKSRVTFIARQPPLDAMNGLFDRELLPLLSSDRRGEGSRADDAFRRIVERYVNLVHASALRQVRDFALAEDVTQAVFIVLWNKSATVRDAAALPAWLLSVTHWAARDAIKRRTIRHRHEQQAAALNGTNAMNTDASVDFNVLAANLDAALNRLPPADRSVVAMRYLSGRSFKEVSESMGISEEAARKRSSRALERLRDLLSKHGVHSAADLLENSLAQLALLPAGDSTAVLADKIVAACHGTAGASASVGTLSKTAQLVITMSKIKTAALVASAVALALAGGVVVSVKMVGSGGWLEVPQQTVVVPPEQTTAAAASAALPPVPDYTGPYAAQLANGYQFQVIGVCRNPRESKAWWEPDGTPMSSSPLLEPLDFARFDDLTRAGRPANYSTGDEYAIVMRVPNLPLQPDGFSGDYNCSFSPGSLRWAFSQPRIALPSTRECVLIELVHCHASNLG